MKLNILFLIAALLLSGCQTNRQSTSTAETDKLSRIILPHPDTHDLIVIFPDGSITLNNETIEINDLAANVKKSRVAITRGLKTPDAAMQDIMTELSSIGITNIGIGFNDHL